jgi:hypothetical protein
MTGNQQLEEILRKCNTVYSFNETHCFGKNLSIRYLFHLYFGFFQIAYKLFTKLKMFRIYLLSFFLQIYKYVI